MGTRYSMTRYNTMILHRVYCAAIRLNQGPDSIKRCCLTSKGIPIVGQDGRKFVLSPPIGIHILVRCHLFIESAPMMYFPWRPCHENNKISRFCIFPLQFVRIFDMHTHLNSHGSVLWYNRDKSSMKKPGQPRLQIYGGHIRIFHSNKSVTIMKNLPCWAFYEMEWTQRTCWQMSHSSVKIRKNIDRSDIQVFFFSFTVISDVYRSFIQNKTTFTNLLNTVWLPGNFEIHCERQYLVNFTGLAGIVNANVYKT